MKSATTVIKDLRLSGHTVDTKAKTITHDRPINSDLVTDVRKYLPGWTTKYAGSR